jgi:hypothetical protein
MKTISYTNILLSLILFLFSCSSVAVKEEEPDHYQLKAKIVRTEVLPATKKIRYYTFVDITYKEVKPVSEEFIVSELMSLGLSLEEYELIKYEREEDNGLYITHLGLVRED